MFLIIVALGLYGADLAKLRTTSLWLLWAEAVCFVLLTLYVTIAFLAIVVDRRRFRYLFPKVGAGILLLAGGFVLGRLVLKMRDADFLNNLTEYQTAVDWILQNGGASPKDGQFAALAKQIEVRKERGTNIQVFFVAYPGPLGTRLRGYAYSSTDTWSPEFIAVYGEPKKLTNQWYRI